MTHTYATLEVSAAAYDEVKSRLLAVDYGHTINDEGEIDMHGIALVRESDSSGSVKESSCRSQAKEE